MNKPKSEENRISFIKDLREDKEARVRVIDDAIRHTDCAWCKSQLSDLREVLKEAIQ